MLWLASTILYTVYLALPLASLVIGWRGGAKLRRSITGGWISGTVLAACILAAFAIGLGGEVTVSQTAIVLYFGVGVMLFLRLTDGLLLAVIRRLVPARGRVSYFLAGVARSVLFGGFALPWVMAVLMVNRPRIATRGDSINADLIHEDATFSATDGTRITGWYFPGDQATRTTALLCHGLGGTPAGFARLIGRLHEANIAVLAIDLRAHGNSGGQRCTFGINERFDALGAIPWLKTRGDSSDRIIGVGASLGAAAVLGAAREDDRIDGVVVLSTYATLTDEVLDVSHRHFARPLGWLVRNFGLPMASLHAGVDLRTVRPVDDIAELWPRPTLIVHGTADDIIPLDQGRKLYDSAPIGRSAFWVFNGTHNGILDDASVLQRVVDFIQSARRVPAV